MTILKAVTLEYLANQDNVDKVVYYISKKNDLSQYNFAKYSKSRVEMKNSFTYELDLYHSFIVKILNRCK